MIYVNEKQVKTQELIELLGIQDVLKLDQWKKEKAKGKPYIAVFKLKAGSVKKDKHSGDTIYPTHMLSNPVVCNIPEHGQTAIFFTNTLPSKNKSGKIEYSDPNYQFTDWQELIDPLAETEKFLMFYL